MQTCRCSPQKHLRAAFPALPCAPPTELRRHCIHRRLHTSHSAGAHCRHPGGHWILPVLGMTQIITPSPGSAAANHSPACGNSPAKMLEMDRPRAYEYPNYPTGVGRATQKDRRITARDVTSSSTTLSTRDALMWRRSLVPCALARAMGLSITLQAVGQSTVA